MRHEHDGGGRRPRFFGHGDLRLVILDILTRDASHGYERSHVDGVLHTLKTLKGYLFV